MGELQNSSSEKVRNRIFRTGPFSHEREQTKQFFWRYKLSEYISLDYPSGVARFSVVLDLEIFRAHIGKSEFLRCSSELRAFLRELSSRNTPFRIPKAALRDSSSFPTSKLFARKTTQRVPNAKQGPYACFFTRKTKQKRNKNESPKGNSLSANPKKKMPCRTPQYLRNDPGKTGTRRDSNPSAISDTARKNQNHWAECPVQIIFSSP